MPRLALTASSAARAAKLVTDSHPQTLRWHTMDSMIIWRARRLDALRPLDPNSSSASWQHLAHSQSTNRLQQASARTGPARVRFSARMQGGS